MKPQDVATLLQMPQSSVYRIIERAKTRGFDPTSNPPRVEHYHVADKPRSGRPKVVTPGIGESIIASLNKGRSGREKSAEYLAYEAGISESSALHFLNSNAFKKRKPTWKPGLTDAMRFKRLAFAKAHKHWTLEYLMSVICTDETSVILGHRRGSHKVWRRVLTGLSRR